MHPQRYGEGRIDSVIAFLQSEFGVSNVRRLAAEVKLDVICDVLQLSAEQLDRLIAHNSPVFRTVKGHAFEAVFEQIVMSSGHKMEYVGGDNAADAIVNDFSLQLKTPTMSGTRGNLVQYKTHKTHGAKSELEDISYYHSVDEFAEFLVGLVSYKPLRILFLRRDELPTHKLAPDRIVSPFRITWVEHPALNAFSRIGIDEVKIAPDLYAFRGKQCNGPQRLDTFVKEG